MLSFEEERKALLLVILDAVQHNIGARASTSQWAALVSKIETDMLEARRLGLTKGSAGHHTDDRIFRHRHVEFAINTEALKYVLVAGQSVYVRYGIGMSGTHANMGIGDSLLPGIWWDDVALAANVLSDCVEKALAAERAEKSLHAAAVAAAHAALASRTVKKEEQ